MKRVFALALLLAVALAAPAAGQTTILPAQTATAYQPLVDRSRVPTPDEVVYLTIQEGACGGGALGCGWTGSIELLPFAPTAVFFHELGHLFDARYLGPERRAWFLGVVRHTSFEWWGLDYERSGGELFADAYALCAVSKRIWPRWSYTVGSGLVRGDRLAAVCAMIRASA